HVVPRILAGASSFNRSAAIPPLATLPANVSHLSIDKLSIAQSRFRPWQLRASPVSEQENENFQSRSREPQVICRSKWRLFPTDD
ncbi:MAG TPA: hypothetical protein VFV38_16165, partial [Ktedonobacteraceae bacterium]|nr:hypothetical protein [Ktedonobacteraceae bacterium]